jgi:hypothetical protein
LQRAQSVSIGPNGAGGLVFGPERFERSTAAPVRAIRTVSSVALANVNAPYTLHLLNGPPGTSRASSAIVTIDGVSAVVVSDVSRNVESLERIVELKPGSEIAVELRGAPGSAIELTITGVPKPETPPTLLGPTQNARIVQNDQTTGCPPSPMGGYGFRIAFSWTPATGPQPIAGYEITAGYPGSIPIIPGVIVAETNYVTISCGAFVINAFLDGWQWRVRARYADGSFGPSSATGTFGFTAMPTPPVVLAFSQIPPSYGGAATRVSVSGAVDANTSASVTLAAVVEVPISATGVPYPFVEFLWTTGSTRQAIGRSAGPELTQTPTSRFVTYKLTWAPPPLTPIGALSIVAVRTDFGGVSYETPAVTVTVVP